jgi:hypothetical protein
MSAWIVSIEGTGRAGALGAALALLAALLHAIFGALQKGRHDPLAGARRDRRLLRADGGALRALRRALARAAHVADLRRRLGHPRALQMGRRWPTRRGAFTVVYPVMRGTGPLFAVIGAWLIFGETFTGVQWLGVAVLLSGLYGLALYNLSI